MRALDLFCGGGGAALGLMQAGFDVVGVDKDPHPNYPGEFIQGDVFEDAPDVMGFDFVWASPPCQAFSRVAAFGDAKHPDLIMATRKLIGLHPLTCIENVPKAPIRADYVLTGPTFGLEKILRRRHFEVSWFGLQPTPIPQRRNVAEGFLSVAGGMDLWSSREGRKRAGLPKPTLAEGLSAMGIDIPMTMNELCEAIPPAYSKFIAEQAIAQMKRSR